LQAGDASRRVIGSHASRTDRSGVHVFITHASMAYLLERGHQCINRQLRGVGRGLRHRSHSQAHVRARKPARLMQSLAYDQTRKSRATSDGGHTSFGLESRPCDSIVADLQRQTQHITAGRIFNLRKRIRLRQIARVPGILKVIEQLGRVHYRTIVKRPPRSQTRRGVRAHWESV